MKVKKGCRARMSSATPPDRRGWSSAGERCHYFKAVAERLSLRYTYFSSGGMPLRAKADLG